MILTTQLAREPCPKPRRSDHSRDQARRDFDQLPRRTSRRQARNRVSELSSYLSAQLLFDSSGAMCTFARLDWAQKRPDVRRATWPTYGVRRLTDYAIEDSNQRMTCVSSSHS